MKAQLSLERIGDSQDRSLREFGRMIHGKAEGFRMPWVAELTAIHPRFGFARRFLEWNKALEDANGAGSRGVRAIYILETGRVYEVFQRTSWKGSRRFFCRVTGSGDVEEISKTDCITKLEHDHIDKILVPDLTAAAGD